MNFQLFSSLLLISLNFVSTLTNSHSSSSSSIVSESGSSSSTIECDGAEECYGATLSSTKMYFNGYYSGQNGDFMSTDGYFYGAYSGYDASIKSYYTYGYGFNGLSYSDLSTYIGYIRGYLGAYYANIESYSNTLYLFLYGYYSGYYADVLCYSGNECHIYCGNVYGCYNLDIYCYSGATCYYDCNDDSEYCPTIYSGVESNVISVSGDSYSSNKEHITGLTDDEITNYHSISRENAYKMKNLFENNIRVKETINNELNDNDNDNDNVNNGIEVNEVNEENEEEYSKMISSDFENLPTGQYFKREYNAAIKASIVKREKHKYRHNKNNQNKNNENNNNNNDNNNNNKINKNNKNVKGLINGNDNIFNVLKNNSYIFTFAGGMLVMLLSVKLYTIYKHRKKEQSIFSINRYNHATYSSI